MTVRRNLKKYVALSVIGAQVSVAGLLSMPALANSEFGWGGSYGATTGVHSQINAASQNNVELWQQGGSQSNGWMNAEVSPVANTAVYNGVNAASQNNVQFSTSNPWGGWNSGFSANTGVNNAVNAASQNNVAFRQERQGGMQWRGGMNAYISPMANTSVHNGINAASQNNFNGWWR
jgi:hypothetical protein